MVAVRDVAGLLGAGTWQGWPMVAVTLADVADWPYSAGLSVNGADILSSFDWPGDVWEFGG